MTKTKTNAMRQLDTAGIPYRTMEYEADASDLSGVHVAEQLGQPCEQIFKTLVLRGEKNDCYVCCIPVAEEVDLKKAARVFGVKRLELLPLKELLPATGYIRGGCSPIGMKKRYPTCIDETAVLFGEIAVSGGVRGEQIFVSPESLAEFVGAEFADLVKEMH